MFSRNIKFFIGIFIFLAYASVGVFGLFQFGHINEMPMADCPYTGNTFAMCDNSLNHISNWQQFSKVVFYGFIILALSVLFFVSLVLLSTEVENTHKRKYHLFAKILYTPQKILRFWLSLFENSPSFIFKA